MQVLGSSVVALRVSLVKRPASHVPHRQHGSKKEFCIANPEVEAFRRRRQNISRCWLQVDLECIDKYYVATILMISTRPGEQVSFLMYLSNYVSC
jgi:hypothetical protein